MRDLSGNFISGVGETLVSVDRPVRNDLQVRCFQSGDIDRQVGKTVCLHTAFIENNFERVALTQSLSIDLLFFDQTYTKPKVIVKRMKSEDGNSSDSCPEQCPRDCEREESKDSKEALDNKD